MIKQILIGRGDECQVRIIDQSQKVSRNHATLKIYGNGKMYIIDHSSNGTWVNGVKISQNVEYPINRGDSVSFAHTSELNWGQIPKMANKVVLYSLLVVIVLGLITIAYILTIPKQINDRPSVQEVKSIDDVLSQKKLHQEKLTQDSIKRNDSILIAKETRKNPIVKTKEKIESQKRREAKPVENDSTRIEKKIIF